MRIQTVRMRNFRRFTDLTIQRLPETARLVVLAGPNGVGKSSFFDGLQSWYQLAAWGSAHGSDVYISKLGAVDPSQWYQRVEVDLHGEHLGQTQLQGSSVYFRTAYRHEVDFSVTSISQPRSLIGNSGQALRAVDVDLSVSDNYQRLLWQTFSAIYDGEVPEDATKAQIRDRLTGRLRESLLRVLPDLELTRVGGLGQGNAFEFTKGKSRGFPYVNLSAGEKAVFDLLLDAITKADAYQDSIWCIDEPEIHIGTRAQGALLRELVSLIPKQSQLFLASHSLGLMGEAVKMAHETYGEVVFLDFEGHDFDDPVVMEPVAPTRELWKRVLAVALDDLSALVAPSTLVLCEGSGEGFDARCLRVIFAAEFPDADFISVGNSHDAQSDKIGITSALQTIAEGTKVIRLRDRDLATDSEVQDWRTQGTRVLSRRHLEAYLYDLEVLEALCDRVGMPEAKTEVAQIRDAELRELAQRNKDADDVKAASGPIYIAIRKRLNIAKPGTTARAFAEEFLAPLIQPNKKVYNELKKDVFG